MGKEVPLQELESAIEDSESIAQMKTNLINLQNRHGNHRQLFVTNSKGNENEIQHIVRVLDEISDAKEAGYSKMSFEPRLVELPSQIEEKVRSLL